jgi:Ca2+-binding RTX toxin-like protein
LGTSANDVAISSDGTLIYAAGVWSDPFLAVPTNDGTLRIYSAAAGELLHSYAIGTRLGAMDISPDGTFALITELSPAAGVATVYKVDLATGAFQTFNFSPSDGESGPFFDVAILSDGTAMMTLNYQGSGNVQVKILDVTSGEFTEAPLYVGQNSFLSPSPDGSEVLIGFANSSDAPIMIYRPGVGLIAQHGGYEDGVMNFNRGIQAFDTNTGRVAQFVGNNGLHIYDGNLGHEIDLSHIYSQWAYDVYALTFDRSGEHLFILTDSGHEIVVVSTLNWAVVQRFDLGSQSAFLDDFGGRLLVAPDGAYLTVVTTTGLVKIDNPGVGLTAGATPDADSLVGTSGTDIVDGVAGNDILTGGAGRDVLAGGDGNDTINGGDDDDAVEGGAGDDIIDGGAGNDTAGYSSAGTGVFVNLALATAQNTGGAGLDSLSGVENLYGSAFEDTLLGDGEANKLRGQAGDDVLVGGGGDDELNGGAGVDTIDYSQEAGGGGVMVNASRNTISDGLVTLGPGEALDSFGFIDRLNSIEHIVTGAGADHVFGGDLAEVIDTGAGNDYINGGGGADALDGGAGNDTLNGGAGADAMHGGVGDDTYVVDSSGDQTVEDASAGLDRVLSSVTHTLKANVENLTLTGSSVLSGTGNSLANVITGNSAANRLFGKDGSDTLIGNAGNDTLDGGVGADGMTGGTGNDNYVVDNAGDVVTELAGGGTDKVSSSISYTLGGNVENLVLTGRAASGTGNELANSITGNSSANTLSGGAGNDKLLGGGGSDLLYGEEGNDSLTGGTGLDQFFGGAGADRFIFRGSDVTGTSQSSQDLIQDFSSGEGDRIGLNLIDANSTLSGNQAFAFVGTAGFSGAAGQLRYEQIAGKTFIQGDTNGDGIADFWIALNGSHTLSSGDMIL